MFERENKNLNFKFCFVCKLVMKLLLLKQKREIGRVGWALNGSGENVLNEVETYRESIVWKN